ncbi:MAG: TonB family protein [Acidobacteriota bacterium]|nr:TonB family protein [Acidobacteriota bacterium]
MTTILPLFFILTTLVRPAIDTRHIALSIGGQIEWYRVTPQDEEFSILTPVLPAFMDQGKNRFLHENGEKILERRSYSGYADGFMFVIESYKAERPQKLLKELENRQNQRTFFERELAISGFSGKQFSFNSPRFFGKELSFATKHHVYLITVASIDENNNSVARFLSSLILGDNISEPATGNAFDIKESDLYKSAVSSDSVTVQPQGPVFSGKDVQRKAVIVWRPEPIYTEKARNKQLSGTVVLRGIFGADGQVKILKVVQGLDYGLTEKAIEAALSIRYFPGEKDGQPVSQYIQIEYNFNLY